MLCNGYIFPQDWVCILLLYCSIIAAFFEECEGIILDKFDKFCEANLCEIWIGKDCCSKQMNVRCVRDVFVYCVLAGYEWRI
jgi:hypothetical protein